MIFDRLQLHSNDLYTAILDATVYKQRYNTIPLNQDTAESVFMRIDVYDNGFIDLKQSVQNPQVAAVDALVENNYVEFRTKVYFSPIGVCGIEVREGVHVIFTAGVTSTIFETLLQRIDKSNLDQNKQYVWGRISTRKADNSFESFFLYLYWDDYLHDVSGWYANVVADITGLTIEQTMPNLNRLPALEGAIAAFIPLSNSTQYVIQGSLDEALLRMSKRFVTR